MMGPTAKRLRELLSYDPAGGNFYWRVDAGRWGSIKAGTLAGSRRKDGRIQIWIDGRLYFAHRLAWLYMTGSWPAAEIDHRDTDVSNNRWDNLREATSSQNKCNRSGDGLVGFKGVSFDPRRGTYYARVKLNKKQRWLGSFQSAAAAHEEYCAAANDLHGEFARVQ
jgi:hypothetical protein